MVGKYERRWVVVMELSKCFDTLNHDLILSSITKRVKDRSILVLLKAEKRGMTVMGDRKAKLAVRMAVL